MRVGVVGLGSWGSRVYPEYEGLVKEGLIDGVETYDEVKDSTCRSFDDFVKKVDMVHVCTPNKTHYDICHRLLSDGKHVLMEKPMTQDAEKAYRLIEVSNHMGCQLMVGHIFRFANVIRKAREIIDANAIGGIYHISLYWTCLMKPMPDTILWDLLPHPLDIIHFITGQYPYDGDYISAHWRQAMVDEAANVQLAYDGFFAGMEFSWVKPKRQRLMEITGENGMLSVECVDQIIELHDKDGIKKVPVVKNNTIRDEALNFIDAVKNNHMRYNGHIIGARNVEAIERILKKKRIMIQ